MNTFFFEVLVMEFGEMEGKNSGNGAIIKK
jgi:hypothetical protein